MLKWAKKHLGCAKSESWIDTRWADEDFPNTIPSAGPYNLGDEADRSWYAGMHARSQQAIEARASSGLKSRSSSSPSPNPTTPRRVLPPLLAKDEKRRNSKHLKKHLSEVDEAVNKRLATSGFCIPPYRSMHLGVNVHFIDLSRQGLQFRRMFAEENEMGGGGKILCFHVRIPPVRFGSKVQKIKKGCTDCDYMTEDPEMMMPEPDIPQRMLNFEPMQEIRITTVDNVDGPKVKDMGHDVSNRAVMYDDDTVVYILFVHSFICSRVGTHGVLWCTPTL